MNGKFSGIVNGGGGNFDNIFDGWDEVQSADDFGTPIPAGKYVCIWRKGELTASKKGTPSYKLTLEVESGDHAGRKVWFDIWLTAASRTIAKRDLEKLGITNPREQLKQPIPKWLRLQVQVGLQADDSGIERNSVLAFKVLEKIQPEADPFAPDDATTTPAGSVSTMVDKLETPAGSVGTTVPKSLTPAGSVSTIADKSLTPDADPFAPESEGGR